ncbi:transposase [Streptomyces longispororuber]|uniref:transposase n=1 Tax=Streptomyces longispororuber TaxID=68230 RepID=UPI0036FA209A
MAGRARVPDRQVLCGILFVLQTGIPWEYPPQGLGSGSGRTCRRGLAAWNEAGVWDQLHVVLLKTLRTARQLHSSRAVIDSSPVRAARRDPKRSRPGRARTAGQQAPRPHRRAGHHTRARGAARAPHPPRGPPHRGAGGDPFLSTTVPHRPPHALPNRPGKPPGSDRAPQPPQPPPSPPVRTPCTSPNRSAKHSQPPTSSWEDSARRHRPTPG